MLRRRPRVVRDEPTYIDGRPTLAGHPGRRWTTGADAGEPDGWVFWHGPERAFHGWYLNLQEPFRRTPQGYDTQDLELDIWVPAEGRGC